MGLASGRGRRTRQPGLTAETSTRALPGKSLCLDTSRHPKTLASTDATRADSKEQDDARQSRMTARAE